MKKILVGTATYNEFKNIKKLINKINNLNFKLDILIVDDDSKDGTLEEILKLKRVFSNIKLIKRKDKSGLDTAHKIIYKYAKQNKYRYLITMDADLSHEPKIIPIFLKNIKNYDCVIGSRYIRGGKNELKGFRLFISIYGNKLIKKVLNTNLNEFTTSYRCFDILKLKNFNLNQVKARGYSFFMYTIFLLIKNNFRIKEIPIKFKERNYGRSKIPKIEIFRTIINLILIKIKT